MPGAQKMATTEKYERLSALTDDELQGRALNEAIDELLSDPQLQQCWALHHLVRDGMNDGASIDMGRRLQQRLHVALEQEPTVLAPRRIVSRGWMRHVAGIAVAASVTGVAIVGIQQLNQPAGSTGHTQAPALASTPSPRETIAQAERAPSSHGPAQVAEQVRSDWFAPYLVNHNEYSSSTNMHGMLPYVRIVGHGSNP